ncbi:Bromodomain-containing protein [Parathielavia hyrcaniae]|uniref:Bromodomain-containing protein n=1 Tax=Parathielavia hyrcaniae TaxID=113614 RepID=A0AAN6PYH0_9PEZI|nr:Bromodomain-containing protein [Parathielavia hyrcaniae]
MSDEPAPQQDGAAEAEAEVEVEVEVEDTVKDAVVDTSVPAEPQPFSWLQPHPIFVIALVGPEETPFGLQKDFLCSKSFYYRKFFGESASDGLENLVRLPDTSVEVFAYAQNFLYTGNVFPNLDNLPSYEVLIGVWKLGHDLGIDGLCDATLDAMAECRRITQHIPATPLLVQVWKDTPEGSSIRKLLLSWAAEYMRSSESRAEFARSLPQEVLSELVVTMSSLESPPLLLDATPAPPSSGSGGQRRSAPEAELDDADGRPAKKRRASDAAVNGAASAPAAQGPGRKLAPRASLSGSKPGPKPGSKRRTSAAVAGAQQFSANQKLNFCADLLARMLSGPGFWTRVVGPFKDPVDPERDAVPDYLDVVKKPMDLSTMKAKMDRREYADETEFLADMNQIFTNCYTYWRESDPMWAACEKLQKSFEDKFGQMNKWIAKMEGNEEN